MIKRISKTLLEKFFKIVVCVLTCSGQLKQISNDGFLKVFGQKIDIVLDWIRYILPAWHKDGGIPLSQNKLILFIKILPKPIQYFLMLCVKYMSAADMKQAAVYSFASYQTTCFFFCLLYGDIKIRL